MDLFFEGKIYLERRKTEVGSWKTQAQIFSLLIILIYFKKISLQNYFEGIFTEQIKLLIYSGDNTTILTF